MRSKSGRRYGFHSVTMTSASAPSSGLVVGVAVLDAVAEVQLAGGLHGDRVVDAHAGAALEQAVDDDERGRLAHVVGLGLEGEAPDGEVRPARSPPKCSTMRVEQEPLLLVVHALDGLQDAEQSTPCACSGPDERLHVLREAAAAVAGAGEQELVADARVGADALAHEVDVGADRLAQPRRPRS